LATGKGEEITMSTQLAAQSTEERVFAVATDMLFEYGYHGTTLRALAEAVGITTPSIYYHIQSKQNLLYTIMKRILTDVHSEVLAATAAVDDPWMRLEAAIEAHITMHAERRKEVFIADSEVRALEGDYRTEIVAIRDEYGRFYKELVRACLDEAHVSGPDVDLMSYAILSTCTGVASWYSPKGRHAIEFIARQYATLIRSGLASYDVRPAHDQQ
jgi:AcrR family transcriptional regulator